MTTTMAPDESILPVGKGLRLSVIIPHLNQPSSLDRCLASLAAGRRKAHEILVVDNGSTSLPQAVCDKYPGVRLLQETTPGPGPARNFGCSNSVGEVLAFIDADCLADPEWLSVAEAAMADPTATILGGDVRIALADPERLTALEAYESIYAYRMDRYIAREGFTGTGNLIVRRTVMDAVGPFAGLSVAEDRDWGQRATKMGYRVRYVAAMKVYHPARTSFAELAIKWDRHTAHDFASACEQPGGRLRFLLKTLAMAASPVAEIPRVLGSDRIKGWRSRLLAFACLLKIRLYRAWIMARLVLGADASKLSGAWNR
jgi:glycosyltransferase involved in cell wall biosynthesis